jgi:hypothetical protein
MQKIIAITGLKGSGKDTISSIICKHDSSFKPIAFADKLKDTQLIEYFKINPNSPNINIVIFNFKKDIYYIHPNDFDINSSSVEKCEKDIKNLIENMNKLKFTTGNFLEDLFLKFGIQASSNTIQLYIMIFILFIVILPLTLIICCCDTNENDKIDYSKIKKE